MRLLILLLAFAMPAGAQVPDAKVLEGCWDNTEKDRERGHYNGLCFEPEDVIVFFWGRLGELDYFEVQWAFDSDSIILIHDTSCKYRLEEKVLQLAECRFQGKFLKYEDSDPRK